MSKRNDTEYISEENTEEAEEKVKKIKKKLKKAEKEKKEYLDGWQRERAEFANYKRDVQNRLDEQRESVTKDVITEFLQVLDSIELMMQHVPDEVAETNWYKGVEQIQKQVEQTLKTFNVEEISAKEGDKFDPQAHEATEGTGETIEEVIQKGYKMGDETIRPTKVKVK